MTSPDPALQLSRELALRCTRGGVVTWSDARAVRLLGAVEGTLLRARAVPVTERKVDRLLERVEAGDGSAGGLSVMVDGRPATMAFRGLCLGEELSLVGSLVPEDYAALLGEVTETMSELAELHRRTERQQLELSRRNEELVQLNRQLQESSRGLLALYQELDEKSESLQRAAELKSRLFSNVTHEFRTPINSVMSLADLLLSRIDGPLTVEQETQLQLLRKAAVSLGVLVDDLLEFARAEAGRMVLRPTAFTVDDLFTALKGMMRPLQTRPDVALLFEAPRNLPELNTDEGKLAQILRNLVSNALKFTERGTVRVTAAAGPGQSMSFVVQDTGIGIAPEHHGTVFEEFMQLESPLQAKVKGTGLGLPFARRLAQLLGGDILLQSQPGAGSTFTVTVPLVHPDVRALDELRQRSRRMEAVRTPVLVVEDDAQTMFLYERYLHESDFQLVPARTLSEARAALQRLTPAAVVLDVMLEGESSWGFLAELKASEKLRHVPVLMVSVVDRAEKAAALGADDFVR
ncbi:MAG: ATP-binding protein, partial [Myxococcales bacterium]